MALHIKNLFSSLIPHCEPWKMKLIQDWKTVIGDLHEHVTLINIQKNTLILGVFDSTWLQELYILSPVLVKTINEYLGNNHVTELRFKNIGYKKKQINVLDKSKIKKKRLKKRAALKLSSNEQDALESIQDPGLRTSLEQYLMRCKEIE